jgi:hypothetical protein
LTDARVTAFMTLDGRPNASPPNGGRFRAINEQGI